MNARVLGVAMAALILGASQSVASQKSAQAPPRRCYTPFRVSVHVTETKKGLLSKAKIKSDSAFALAKTRVKDAALSKAEIRETKGKLVYTFALIAPGQPGMEDVHVNGMTGEVWQEHEPDK